MEWKDYATLGSVFATCAAVGGTGIYASKQGIDYILDNAGVMNNYVQIAVHTVGMLVGGGVSLFTALYVGYRVEDLLKGKRDAASDICASKQDFSRMQVTSKPDAADTMPAQSTPQLESVVGETQEK